MRHVIPRSAQRDEYPTDEGCWILEQSNDADDPAASIARARVPAGQTTKWHRVIGIVERYVILSGEGRVGLGTLAPIAVGPGDVVRIPAGEAQRIANTGDDDLVFWCICTPRFEWQYYRSLE